MNSPDAWNILYRGPLSSCNYACHYCPFAKTSNTAAELQADKQKLNRFVDWVSEQSRQNIGILITPWGEAMIHRSYQAALKKLSHLPNVYRASIQTNLSGKLEWLSECNLNTLALWATFHPSQTTLDSFLKQCEILNALGVHYSVGMVGLKEDLTLFEEMRSRLPDNIYLWANAYKDVSNYYSDHEIERFVAIDPQFRVNTINHPSYGRPCNAGHLMFSVDGEGDAYRCHFIKTKIGNLYDGSLVKSLSSSPQPCTNQTCDCHIGYIHLPHLQQQQVYGDHILNRSISKHR